MKDTILQYPQQVMEGLVKKRVIMTLVNYHFHRPYS